MHEKMLSLADWRNQIRVPNNHSPLREDRPNAEEIQLMQIRRIVTATDPHGQAFVQSDALFEQAYQSYPGFANTVLWLTDQTPQVGVDQGADPVPSLTRFLPPAGGTRLLTLTVPADASMLSPGFDPTAFGAETARRAPGFIETFEPDTPGMHTTDTVDYGVLLDGEIWLELDGQQEVKLRPFDVVIQNGTRHAWRNKSSRAATLLFVLVGAARVA